MKTLLSSLVIIGVLAPISVSSQQVNVIQECRNYVESYTPGGVNSSGNYVQGGVYTQRNNVDCQTGNVYSSTPYYNNSQYSSNNNGYYGYNNQYSGRKTNPNCNPTRTLLGATLGGAIGRSMTSTYNNRNNRGWATALGAALGGLAFVC
jgi:hypothetical protein